MEISLDSLIASWQFVWQENNLLIGNLTLSKESEKIQTNQAENETEKLSKHSKCAKGSAGQNDTSDVHDRHVCEATSWENNDSSDFAEHFETSTELSEEVSDLSTNEWLEKICKKRRQKRYRSVFVYICIIIILSNVVLKNQNTVGSTY
jgi:hypothetical protein